MIQPLRLHPHTDSLRRINSSCQLCSCSILLAGLEWKPHAQAGNPGTLYLDFDGFFARVEQQACPNLRGRPVGVIPFEGTDRTCVIAVSREAKVFGVRSVMTVPEARRLCPDIVLVPQSPDLYRRAHNTLMAEIESIIPIEAVKSIDELTCRLDMAGRSDPLSLAARLKASLAKNVGPYIT